MKTKLGLIIFTLGVINSNGTDEHPAMITRVWSDKDTVDGPVMVNATVFPDCSTPYCQGSISVFETRALAKAEQERVNAIGDNRAVNQKLGKSGPMVAFWPDNA